MDPVQSTKKQRSTYNVISDKTKSLHVSTVELFPTKMNGAHHNVAVKNHHKNTTRDEMASLC